MASENKENKPDGENPEGKPMTQEEIAAMVTGATERMRKSLSAEFKESLKTVAESIPTMFKEHAEALKAELPKPPTDKPSDKPSPELLAMKQQVEALTTSIKERDQKLAEAEARSRNDQARNALKAELAQHVRPEALEMTAQLLFDAQKRVGFTEDGAPVFKTRKSPYAGAAEEDMDLPIKDGVAHWLKSDEAKIFIPPPNGGGNTPSQQRGNPRGVRLGNDGLPSYDSPATTDDERVRRADEKAAALAAKYPHISDQY